MREVTWKQMADWGLVGMINASFLHPLGLAMGYNQDTKDSSGAYIADDYVWEFSPEMYADIHQKFNTFVKNRKEILDSIEEQAND